MMNLDEYEGQLLDWSARYEEWAKPIDDFFGAAILRCNVDGYTFDDFTRDTQAFREECRKRWDPDVEALPTLERLCRDYLEATPPERALCRSGIGQLKPVSSYLLRVVYDSAGRIQRPDDAGWLRKGLAAVSIQDGGDDIRDVMVALAEICVKSEEAGIDPEPHFRDVAAMSSGKKPNDSDPSISELLANFQDYAVLQERRSNPT